MQRNTRSYTKDRREFEKIDADLDQFVWEIEFNDSIRSTEEP